MRPFLDGNQTHLQQGSGTTYQSKHKTTSVSLRTTLESRVCLTQQQALKYGIRIASFVINSVSVFPFS